MKKYFANIETLEELKKAYRKAAMELHPDRGGDAKAFAEMQNEYEAAAKRLANNEQSWKRHQKKDGTQKTAQEIFEEQKEFAEIINKLINLDGLQLEICGSWLWITGDTKEWKEQLKEVGAKWASKKKAWYWFAGEWYRKTKKHFTMDEIRTMHGSTVITPDARYTALHA